jgi:hypothetical protein
MGWRTAPVYSTRLDFERMMVAGIGGNMKRKVVVVVNERQ